MAAISSRQDVLPGDGGAFCCSTGRQRSEADPALPGGRHGTQLREEGTVGCHMVAACGRLFQIFLQVIDLLERARGFEPPTPTLARLCSTPELHPRPGDQYHSGGGGLQEPWCASGSRRFGTRPCNGQRRAASSRDAADAAAAPLTPEQLFARLDALGIPHRTYTHPPVFTVAEAAALRGSLPGGHCKSLFLKDKKGRAVARRRARRAPHRSETAGRRARRAALLVRQPRAALGKCSASRRAASRRSRSSTIRRTASRLCSTKGCWSTTRSIIIRSSTTAPPRSRRAICCGLSRLAATAPRIVDLERLGVEPRPAIALSRLEPADGRERLSSRHAAAMFRSGIPGRKLHGE